MKKLLATTILALGVTEAFATSTGRDPTSEAVAQRNKNIEEIRKAQNQGVQGHLDALPRVHCDFINKENRKPKCKMADQSEVTIADEKVEALMLTGPSDANVVDALLSRFPNIKDLAIHASYGNLTLWLTKSLEKLTAGGKLQRITFQSGTQSENNQMLAIVQSVNNVRITGNFVNDAGAEKLLADIIEYSKKPGKQITILTHPDQTLTVDGKAKMKRIAQAAGMKLFFVPRSSLTDVGQGKM